MTSSGSNVGEHLISELYSWPDKISEALHGQTIDEEVAHRVEINEWTGYSNKRYEERTGSLIIDNVDNKFKMEQNKWQVWDAENWRCENCCHDPLPLQTFSATVSYLFSDDQQINCSGYNKTNRNEPEYDHH